MKKKFVICYEITLSGIAEMEGEDADEALEAFYQLSDSEMIDMANTEETQIDARVDDEREEEET